MFDEIDLVFPRPLCALRDALRKVTHPHIAAHLQTRSSQQFTIQWFAKELQFSSPPILYKRCFQIND